MGTGVAVDYFSDSEEEVNEVHQNYITNALLDRANVDSYSFYNELCGLRDYLPSVPYKFIHAVRTVTELLSTDKKRVKQSTEYFSFKNRLTDIRNIVALIYSRLDSERKQLELVLREVDKFKD